MTPAQTKQQTTPVPIEHQATPEMEPQITDTSASKAETNHTLKPPVKVKQEISFRLHNGQTRSAEVLSRAGKKTGKFQNWYNIKYTHPSTIAGNTENIDLSAIKDLNIIDKTPIVPDNQTTDGVFITENLTYDDAKIRELQSWKENNVYEEVPYTKQKCISVRWICSLKQIQVYNQKRD